MKRDLGGASPNLAVGRVGGRARPFRKDDDVDALREQTLGFVERADGIVVEEEDTPNDQRIEEISLGGRLDNGSCVRQQGNENDDIDESEVVGDDHASAYPGEACAIGRREHDAEKSGDVAGADKEPIARAHERAHPTRREEGEQGKADAADHESADAERKKERGCENAARQSDEGFVLLLCHWTDIIAC